MPSKYPGTPPLWFYEIDPATFGIDNPATFGVDTTENIATLDNETTLDVPVDRVLKGAVEQDLETALVLGWDANGDLYLASSMASGPEMLWLLESAKTALLNRGG